MGFVNNYPYTDFHELNLDWVLNEIKTLHADWDNFKVINAISFDGNWDITKQYQAWTLVNDNNVGFISVKATPAGVSITNSEYWKPVADYSAITADLQTRVIAVENKVAGNVTERRVIALADSYGTVNQPGFLQIIKDNMGFDDNHFLIDALGGRSFARPNTTFIEAIRADKALVEAEKITDILVLGGFNDAKYIHSGSAAGLFNKISEFINYCKLNFPNANVYIGFLGALRYDSTGTDATNKDLYDARNVYVKSALLGAKYLNNVEYILRDSRLMTPTDYHPNADGNAMLAEKVAEAWLTGSCTAEGIEPMSANSHSAMTSTAYRNNMVAYIENGIHGIYSRTDVDGNSSIDIRNTNGLGSISPATWFDVFVDDNPLLFTDSLSGTCYGSIAYDGTSIKTPVEWRYKDNKFSIRLQETLANVTIIILRGVNACILSER